MRNEWMRFAFGLLAAAVLVGGLTGCNDALKTDNANLRRENTDLRSELERARAALDATGNERDSLAAEVARLQALLSQRQAPPPPRPVTNQGFSGIEGVQEVRGRGTVTANVSGDVLFASGQATLRATAKQTLNQVASVLNGQYAGNQIRVEGHTDSDPIRKSNWRDNYHLARARAEAVRDYLVTRGVSAGRMSVVSHGPDKPVADNKTTAGKAKNRRVEIVVLVPN